MRVDDRTANKISDSGTEIVMPETNRDRPYKMIARELNFYYGSFRALIDISLDIEENKVSALIGPSGCGKSTFLRTLNRMNETIPGTRLEGTVQLDDIEYL